MTKLLRADFARLWKNKVFWIGIASMFIWPTIMLIAGYRTSLSTGYVRTLDGFFFQYAPLIGGFCAVFTSLFLGTDYSDGTIRNKIAVGHFRHSIFFANLTISAAASMLMNATWVLTMLTIGTLLFGWFSSGTSIVLIYLGISIFMLFAFATIFTTVGMLNQSKANGAVIALLVFLGILFCGSYVDNRLNEPEMYSGGIVITDTLDSPATVQLGEPTPNPDYIQGSKRKLFEFLVGFLPTGQGIRMSYMKLEHLPLLPLYSLFIAVIATLVGVSSFRRKDIK